MGSCYIRETDCLREKERERIGVMVKGGREESQWGAEYLNEFSHPREDDDDDDDDDDTMMAKGDRIEIRQKRRNGEERGRGRMIEGGEKVAWSN